MQISISRTDLSRVVKATGKVVESRTTIPILSSLLLSAENGLLTVTATDLDIVATTSTPCTVTAPGAVCVDAKLLTDIAGKAGASDISLEMKDGRLEVKSGRSKFNLAVIGPEDFPTLDGGTFDASFDIDLASLFAPVAFAISNEETRYYLNGIFLHIKEDGDYYLCAVATDGHRLSRHRVAYAAEDAFAGIIVPRKTVGIIPRGVVSVSVSASKIRIVGGDLAITSKLIDGTFPDYERVIPQANELAVAVDRDEMMKAAERVVTVSSEKSKAVKLSVAPGGVLLSARSETGTAEDEVATDYTGSPLEIGFNAAYLRDVFSVLQPGKVTMRLQDGGPALIEGGEEGLDLVIMPMRV